MAMARRGHGEGAIFKAADGRWVARVDLGFGSDGKRRRKEIRCKTKAEALQRLEQARRQLADGLPLTPERLTVQQYLTDWLEHSVKGKVRGRTYEAYEQVIRVHLVPALGRTPLSKLTPADVQAYLNTKATTGLSTGSVAYQRAVLRSALNRAVRWGLVSRNVAALADPPRVRRPQVQPLNLDQARAFLDAVRGNRLEALYTVALAVGLRQGEALGLRWSDVDLEAGTLTVRTTLQRISGTLQLVEPKTSRSGRTIFLPAFAAAALKEHRRRQIAERLQAGPLWEEHGLVFATLAGRPLAKGSLTRDWTRIRKRAELPLTFRFHGLRHSCASLMHAQGADARTIMETLGHTQIATTMNIYTHVFQSVTQDLAARMDSALARPQLPAVPASGDKPTPLG
jgi:integrase